MALFKKTSTITTTPKPGLGWKVLVVDDEPEVHNITKLALDDFSFENKALQIISAYTGIEAMQAFDTHPDIALVFLDVVMESDDAGLAVVKHIREQLSNKFVRIILRTGQAGNAPEREVILNYDINDYKEKTSFDSTKLFTATLSGLRAYNDIMRVEAARKSLDRYRTGLEEVIESSANLFEIRSLRQFARGLLVQLASILHIDKNTLLVRCHGWTVTENKGEYQVLAGTGSFCDSLEPREMLPSDVITYLDRACQKKECIYDGDKFVGYFPTKVGKVNLIYLDGVSNLDEVDKRLIQVFSSNVTIAFDNLYLDKEIFDTQSEIIDTLGDVVENRSKETANHVKRVSHLSRMLAITHGLTTEEADILFMAAPMHDIGKVAIPDKILLKEGKLDPDEWTIMKTHAEIGEQMFSQSSRPVLQAASIVAGQHHEKYDGSGYPRGLKGTDIHVYGRIVAITDVFDALSHKRCYKDAWPEEKVIALLTQEKGKHLDPHLVDLFLGNLDKVREIATKYPD
ncbi:MAG: DUF3369 domain-containing protein [Agarilytica sp.]